MPSSGEGSPADLVCRHPVRCLSPIDREGGAPWLDHSTQAIVSAISISATSRRNSCAAIRPTDGNSTGLQALTILTCNPPLRVEWPAHGALNFPVDPRLSASSAPAIWRADANAHVVIVAGAGERPADYEGMRVLAERESEEGRHLMLAGRGGRHRLLMVATPMGGNCSYLLPADPSLPTRLAAVQALCGSTSVTGNTAATRPVRPTAYQAHRFSMLLGILDILNEASGERLTIREVASKTLRSDLSGLRAIDWKTSSSRRQIQRHLAEARHMASHGYRDLLYPGRTTFQKR